MRILVVDDDGDFVDLTSYALSRHGHLVMTALDRQQAMERVLTDAPDLVLLNVTTANDDGFALCRELRGRAAVRTILVSAHGDDVAVVRGYEAGADDYLVKPFSHRQLLLRIDAVMRRAAPAEQTGLGVNA
jgi:DNA-binding response OmpR family regulator